MDFEARLAAGHICAMGVGAWPHLQGLIDAALGPQQAQAVLLIGMQAAALQVSLHGTVSCAEQHSNSMLFIDSPVRFSLRPSAKHLA